MKVFENKYVSIDENEQNQVQRVLDSLQFSGMSKTILEYEAKLKSYFKVKHALAVTSGTSAIEVALRAAGVGAGDQVMTTPLGPVMTPLPILALGAIPVFVDTKSTDSFNISIDDLKKKITSKTKAIITVPMWGYPNDIYDIVEFCREKNIIVIEDVSHCHGTMLGDCYQGTFGDIGIFSTQERKLISTGEGGFLITDNDYLSSRIQELRNFGKPLRKELLDKGLSGEYGHLFGLNYRLNAFSSALGIAQVDKLDSKILSRTENADYYRKNLDLKYLKEIEIIENGRPSYYSIVYIVTHPQLSAFEVGAKLSTFGIVSDTYRFKYKVLFKMPLFESFASGCANSEILSKSIITLPTHEGLTKTNLRFIVDVVNSVLI